MPEFNMASLKNNMHPFYQPWLWLTLWCCAIGAVIIASLVPSRTLPTLPHVTDKAEHLLSYAVLGTFACMLFRSRNGRLLTALGLIGLGCLMEVAQGGLTADRTADWQDALANTIGVTLSTLLGLTPLRHSLVWLDRQLFAAKVSQNHSHK